MTGCGCSYLHICTAVTPLICIRVIARCENTRDDYMDQGSGLIHFKKDSDLIHENYNTSFYTNKKERIICLVANIFILEEEKQN